MINTLGKSSNPQLGENLANIPSTRNTLERHGKETGPAHFTFHLGDVKYSLFGNGEEELYDLSVDPHELHNLADDAEWSQQKARLCERLLDHAPDWFLNTQAVDWDKRPWACR